MHVRWRYIAVCIFLLTFAAAVAGQSFNTKLISIVSPTPVPVPLYGEPELMAAINGRRVVIASNRSPGMVGLVDFNAGLVLAKALARPSGAPNYDGSGQDTQIVRMRDGKFLLSGPGAVVSNKVSADVFWSSSDGAQWSTPTALNSNLVSAPDGASVSHIGYCSEQLPGVGGFDRPELYAYPFAVASGGPYVFITTLCARSDDSPVLLFRSTDGGKSWDDSTIRLSGWAPAAMSASTKHLFIAQCVKQQVMVSFSDDRGKTLTPSDPAHADSFQLDITSPGTVCDLGYDPGAHGNKFSISAVRTKDPDTVVVAYPGVEDYIPAAGKVLNVKKKRRVVYIVAANVKTRNTALLRTVRASGERGSILHLSLIEDPRPEPAGDMASLLYWEESSGEMPPFPPKPWTPAVLANWPATAFSVRTKYSLMVGTSYFTDPADLSVTAWDAKFPQPSPATVKQDPALCAANNSFTGDGWPGCAEQWIGDYMKGGSATNGSQIDFAAVWPQCPAGSCAHYVQVVSVDVSKPLSVGNKYTYNGRPAMPTKAPKYDRKYGPAVEPRVSRRP